MVCIPDLPGFGDSAVCGDDVDDMVEPVAVGMRQLLGLAPCDIVGFSLGSLLGVLIAHQHKDRVGRLLLVAPLVLPLLPKAGLALKRWRGIADPNERQAVHRDNLAVLMFHNQAAIDDTAVSIQSLSAESDRVNKRSLVSTLAFQKNYQEIDCEMAAVLGSEDVLFRARWHDIDPILCSNPSLQWIEKIPDAGHWVQYEQADFFNAVLLPWLLRTRSRQ